MQRLVFFNNYLYSYDRLGLFEAREEMGGTTLGVSRGPANPAGEREMAHTDPSKLN